MKKLLINRVNHLFFFSMMLIIIMLTSCNNDDDSNGTPVITEVRNYAAAPNDTLVNKLVPGQWVVLKGSNLKNAVKITFNGVAAQFDGGLFSDTYAVVQIPFVIPFPSVPQNQLNTIEVANASGSTIFNIDIIAGPPSLAAISNENPVEGEIVTVFGTNLFLISELSFGGVAITDYITKDDGTAISFPVSTITSGPLKITTASGKILTTFNVNDLTTGILCNFDTIGSMAWGTSTSNNDPDFPGNHGWYPILDTGILNAGDGVWWGSSRSINIENGSEWVSATDLDLDIDQFVLKFELNVPGDWNGVSMFIIRDYNWDFLARFEPWKLSETKTANFTTKGKWVTVTIPLTEFRTKKDGIDGTGNSATSLAELFGTKKKTINFLTINTTDKATVTGLRAGIDNIRVVKIK
ncbi:glycan-binding surface protein [Flavobacterium sp. ENC]|uniref:glycan-binding surface protein n=1 Tax=Flavobacterium sp. ENC TaxID=2897330 RepID=UPI001E57940E|nr:glycan-binding surface protein [Flavobacterium sp. ENC]MCD0465265.1 glycan-binding surface protein [Flavobacterium sp. ENC]